MSKKSVLMCLVVIMMLNFGVTAGAVNFEKPTNMTTNERVDALISGEIQAEIEDDVSDVHVIVRGEDGKEKLIPFASRDESVILDVDEIGENYFSALAITPLKRTDTSDSGGVYTFIEVTYYRTQDSDGLNFVKISTVYGGWRSSTNTNLICANLQMHYRGRGDSFGVLRREEKESSIYSTPEKGTAYALVTDEQYYFLEDGTTGMAVGYITYQVKNKSTGQITLDDGEITIGFGDLSSFNPFG